MFTILSIADTLKTGPFPQTGAIIVQKGSGDSSVAQIVQAIASLLTLAIAVWAALQWRTQYATKEWSNTAQFLLKYPRFFGDDINLTYKTKYKDQEAAKYELVARLSIAYLDDVYHLSMKDQLAGWLSGSIRVFAYPHRQWFRDHKSSYSIYFFRFVDDGIKRIERGEE
jgi:hypothetical protein